MTSSCPRTEAMCSGVIPHLSGVFGLVPASSSLSTCGAAVFGSFVRSHHIKSAIFGPNLVRSISFSSVEQPPTRRKFSGLLLPFLGDIVRGFQAFFCSGRNSSSSSQQDMARVHLTLDVMGGQRTLFTSWMTPAFAAIHSRFSAWVALL